MTALIAKSAVAKMHFLLSKNARNPRHINIKNPPVLPGERQLAVCGPGGRVDDLLLSPEVVWLWHPDGVEGAPGAGGGGGGARPGDGGHEHVHERVRAAGLGVPEARGEGCFDKKRFEGKSIEGN